MKTYSELECHRQTHISGHGQSDSQQKKQVTKSLQHQNTKMDTQHDGMEKVTPFK